MPPTILAALAEHHSNERVRASAVQSLVITESLRSARIGSAEARQPVHPLARRRQRWLRRLAQAAAAVEECEPERTVYDAQNSQRLPGREVRGEGDPANSDVAVNEAYDALGDTFDFYCEVFERNSIDGQGLPLDATVHFGQDYDNAYWDGQRMVFGDGDGVVFNRFTISVDVIGHELTHGVTENEAGLVYFGQPGALNESISDVFGSLVKQYTLNQTADQADWLIGEGLLAQGINGKALRSMSDPGSAYDDPQLGGKDPQPKDMSGYVRTLQDNVGVHINSGIPNRAFYETAIRIGGYAWEEAGLIWYDTLTGPLGRTARFQDFANLTSRTATQLFGPGSTEAQAVRDGWAAVGVTVATARQRWWAA